MLVLPLHPRDYQIDPGPPSIIRADLFFFINYYCQFHVLNNNSIDSRKYKKEKNGKIPV